MMKIKIEEKYENPLLKRQDITFVVEHSGTATPPRIDVRDKLAAQMNCQTDQLYIIKLQGLYGQSSTRGLAHLYASKEEALAQEQVHIIKRHSTEEAAPAAPAPAPPAPKEEVEVTPEEKVEEKPADKEKPPEEKKEEAKPPKKEKKAEKEPAKEAPKPAKEEKKKAEAPPKKKKETKKPPKEKDAS